MQPMTDMNNDLAPDDIKLDWAGRWIWTSPAAEAKNAYAFFRRTFNADRAGRLDVDITADSFYTLYLDGRRIARGPSRSHLDYYSYDPFHLDVAAGPHCLAVMVHHVGEVNATMMKGRPGLLTDAKLIVGGETDLSTGPAWRCLTAAAWRSDAAAMMSHHGFWEELDLARLPLGWMDAGFDDSGWGQAVEIGPPPCPPWTRLVRREILPLTWDRIEPAAIVAAGEHQAAPAADMPSKEAALRVRTRGASGTLPLKVAAGERRYITIDFGRTVSGYVTLAFADSGAGAQVDVSFDEMLTPSGAVNPERTYAHMTDRYFLPGGAARIDSAHPRGFRYVTADVAGPALLAAAEAHEEVYPFELQGAFASSAADLERFVAKAALTVRVCTSDAYTDCPTRERVQWMEDMYMHARAAAFAFGDNAMTRRSLFAAAQSQLPDGRINGFFPSERTNCAFASGSLMWLHMLADYWLHTGNRDDIRRLLPAAGRVLEFLGACRDGGGLVATWPAMQFWDWSPIESGGCLLLTNAAYAMALRRLGRHEVFREALGADLCGTADAVAAACHERFHMPDRGLYRDGNLPDGAPSPVVSQHANAMAALAGVCPPNQRQALLRRIIDPANLAPVPVGEASLKAEQRGASDKIVPVGTLWFGHWLCQALFESGLAEEAIAQMRQLWGAYDDLPTFPETRIQAGNTGFCHGWAAGPAMLLPAYVLGVQPVAGGWRETLFSPSPGPLQNARGQFKTPAGVLKAMWVRQENGLRMRLTVPATMTVHVRCGNAVQDVQGPCEWERTIKQ